MMLQWTWEYRYLSDILISFILDKYPEVGLLDHMIVLLWMFWVAFVLFSIGIAPIYILSHNVKLFSFLHNLVGTCYCLFFADSHFNRCEVIFDCGFDLHFTDNLWCWKHFHVHISHLYVFFGKMSTQFLCQFFNLFICFYWVWWVLYIFWILTPYQIYELQIFFPIW